MDMQALISTRVFRVFSVVALLSALAFSGPARADLIVLDPGPELGGGGNSCPPGFVLGLDGFCEVPFSGDPGGGFSGGGGDFGCAMNIDGTCDFYLPSYVTLTFDGSTIFNFSVPVSEGSPVTIDPMVAVGYTYAIGFGDPNFASVRLPVIGDNQYQLLLFDSSANDFVFDSNLTGGVAHDFGLGGVDQFRILGIDTSVGIDPTDQLAFMTELTFVGSGQFTGSMTPIIEAVPEPTILGLVVFGAVVMLGVRRRKWTAE